MTPGRLTHGSGYTEDSADPMEAWGSPRGEPLGHPGYFRTSRLTAGARRADREALSLEEPRPSICGQPTLGPVLNAAGITPSGVRGRVFTVF